VWVENKPEWIARAMGGIIEDMTRTRQIDRPVQETAERRRQLAWSEPRFQVIEEEAAPASDRSPLLRIGYAPGEVKADVTRVNGLDAGVAVGGPSDQEGVAQVSLVGERDPTDWPAPSTHSNRQVGKLQTPTAASALKRRPLAIPPADGGGRARTKNHPPSVDTGRRSR
jgi:hypothetical protein